MKKNWLTILLLLMAVAVLVLSLIPNSILNEANWLLVSFVILAIVIGMVFIRFEQERVDPKEMALIATMASIAGISRIPFAVIMSFQPTTFMVMITGYVFGSQTGFVVGAIAALVSNFFLGQGPWTPWQMVCWGVCGMAAGWLARAEHGFNRITFAVVCGISGYVFGWVMNIWHWVGFVYPLNLKTFIATYIASLPFDTLHAAGNVLFTYLFGKSFYMILMRFKRRMTVTDISGIHENQKT